MGKKSEKHALIDKSIARMLAMIMITVSLVVFCLVATRSLATVASHRSRVITEKRKAADTLKANDAEIGTLIESFKSFENMPESVIGTPEKNSKIILDALPPVYDFPALATSLEKIASDAGYEIVGIEGTDNEVSETDESTSDPQSIEVPFMMTVKGPFELIKKLPVDLERSIRPISIQAIEITGTADTATMQVSAKTYYQAGKNLELRYKEVR